MTCVLYSKSSKAKQELCVRNRPNIISVRITLAVKINNLLIIHNIWFGGMVPYGGSAKQYIYILAAYNNPPEPSALHQDNESGTAWETCLVAAI